MSAPVLDSHGTLTANGTEQNIFTLGTPGVYEMRINVSNMVNGCTTILRRYVEDVDTSTFVLAEEITLSGVQSVGMRTFGPFGVATASVNAGITIEQTGGTLKDYPWSVVSY